MLFESMFGKNILARLGGLVSVSREMAVIDDGNCFIGMENSASLASAASMKIVVRIPSGTEMHIRDVVVNHAGAWVLALSQMSGTYTIGTTFTGFCLNQASHKKTSKTVFSFTYTGTPTLTTLYGRGFGGTVATDINLFTGENEKLVLPAGDYLISLTNASAGAVVYPYLKSKFIEETV
jgi:hypothetical protein